MSEVDPSMPASPDSSGRMARIWAFVMLPIRTVFDTQSEPPKWLATYVLPWILFVALIAAYSVAAHKKTETDPGNKTMPVPSKIFEKFYDYAFKPDRFGDYRLWKDTYVSAKRFVPAFLIACLAIPFGVVVGAFPWIRATFSLFSNLVEKLLPIALFPLILVLVKGGESQKLFLISLGLFPVLMLVAVLETISIPKQQVVKGHSLGFSNLEICACILLPQVMPKMIDTIRLSLKALMTLLIVTEFIESQFGLGFRIFTAQKQTQMAVIIPYVIWISVLLFTLDRLLWILKRWFYPWSVHQR